MRPSPRLRVFRSVFGLALAGVLLLGGAAGPTADRAPAEIQPAFRPARGHPLCPSPDALKSRLLIHHIDVGQGDATLIWAPGGGTMLIDGGPPGKAGGERVLAVLRTCYGIRALDYVVLTHFHTDHLGGLTTVLKEIPVRKALFDPGEALATGAEGGSLAYQAYRTLANRTRKRAVPPLAGRGTSLDLGGGVKVRFVASGGRVADGRQVPMLTAAGKVREANSISVATHVRFGKFDYFNGGDLTGGGDRSPDVESWIAPLVGDVDVYHANHHGSASSSNPALLAALKPEWIVISAGVGGVNLGTYRLPNIDVLRRMAALPSLRGIVMTSPGEPDGRLAPAQAKRVISLDGDVVIETDGRTLGVNGALSEVDAR